MMAGFSSYATFRMSMLAKCSAELFSALERLTGPGTYP
jgi:hypothetical protein